MTRRKAKLIYQLGDRDEQEFPFVDTVEIGRKREGEETRPDRIAFSDPIISACHCRVTQSPEGRFFVRDLSRNGTRVDGRRLERDHDFEIAPNQVIQVGPHRLRLWAADFEVGIATRGGETCYLCELPVRAGDPAVFYYDAAFWETGFLYHERCWNEAELAAKQYGDDAVRHGAAIVLPEVTCARCGELVEVGDVVVRVRGGTRGGETEGFSVLPRVLHERCDDAGGR